MAACPLCRSRKGKRACPALRVNICSACCGEKRIVEIACPESCTYLSSGTENDLRREAEHYLQHQDPRKSLEWLETMESLGFLLEAIERTIAAAPLPSLEDADLLLALESARRSFEAEANGVIYDALPTSPTLQALTRDLLKGVRELRARFDEERQRKGNAPGPVIPVWGPAEAARCFAVLSERCDHHVRRSREVGSFVSHLKRIHPAARGDGEAPDSGRIILA